MLLCTAPGVPTLVFHALTVKNGFFGDINGEFSQNYRHQLYGYRPYKAGRRLFIADGYAYVSYIRGFNYLSPLQESASPQNNDTNSIGWRRFIGNGSGLALSIEAPNSSLPANLSLYTVSKDGSFFAQVDTLKILKPLYQPPGMPGCCRVQWPCLCCGRLLGLQVVSYRSYEIGSVPPELEVRANDLNGSVEEGSVFSLRAIVFDDIQVKNVEFWINGQLVKTDGGFPFSLQYRVPLLSESESFTAMVVARDTGGNEVSSELLSYKISEDVTPPLVSAIFPGESDVIRANESVLMLFSEDLNASDIEKGLTLEFLGSAPDNPVAQTS